MRSIVLTLAGIVLCATLALADPAFRMSYPTGVPRVEISGDYTRSRYSVWRSSEESGPFARLTDGDVLCLGSCFADDHDAVGGRTYWYRFEVGMPDGRQLSFGPYAARVSPEVRRIGATAAPNPGRGPTTLRVFLAGAPGSGAIPTTVDLHDLQGRRVAVLHRGPLAPGTTALAWDGRGSDGVELAAGTYFLRVAAADGRSAVTRVLRLR